MNDIIERMSLKVLELRSDFDIIGQGKVCNLCLTLVSMQAGYCFFDISAEIPYILKIKQGVICSR